VKRALLVAALALAGCGQLSPSIPHWELSTGLPGLGGTLDSAQPELSRTIQLDSNAAAFPDVSHARLDVTAHFTAFACIDGPPSGQEVRLRMLVLRFDGRQGKALESAPLEPCFGGAPVAIEDDALTACAPAHACGDERRLVFERVGGAPGADVLDVAWSVDADVRGRGKGHVPPGASVTITELP
jgi:hypothetical protein